MTGERSRQAAWSWNTCSPAESALHGLGDGDASTSRNLDNAASNPTAVTITDRAKEVDWGSKTSISDSDGNPSVIGEIEEPAANSDLAEAQDLNSHGSASGLQPSKELPEHSNSDLGEAHSHENEKSEGIVTADICTS